VVRVKKTMEMQMKTRSAGTKPTQRKRLSMSSSIGVSDWPCDNNTGKWLLGDLAGIDQRISSRLDGVGGELLR
jgi:hypothetical protein